MKVCRSCHKKFPDNTQFCPECGQRLVDEEAESQAAGGGNDDLVGRVFFGEYTITDQLGEGGMGAVYMAEQNAIDQRIALKVLHAEAAESDEIIQRFHREARVISMLSHPNIVRVFIFGRTDDDLLFLAMEHVEGVELRNKLDGTPIDELRAIKIMKQICSAVAEAHDLGIIHRDLKPENVLLTEFRGDENFVKILDFGIAKIKHPDGQQGPQLTQAGIVYGTPEYLSPEQAQAHDLDNRTDIYALGCMLFEMMTGRVPFQASSSIEILKQKVFEDPPKASDFVDVAPTMDGIIRKAMAKDREDRFSDALEMFDALDVREKEIQSERHVDSRETYFPGSELTGVHRAVDSEDLQKGVEAAKQQSRAADPGMHAEQSHDSLDTEPNDFSGEEFDAKTIAMEAPPGSGEHEIPSKPSQQDLPTGQQPQQGSQPQSAPRHHQHAGQPNSGRGHRPTPAGNPSGQPNQQGPHNQRQGSGDRQQAPQHQPNQQSETGARQPAAQDSEESIERYLLIGGVIGAGIILVMLLGFIAYRVLFTG